MSGTDPQPGVPTGALGARVPSRDRLVQHLRRRSQRPFRPPEGVTYYEQLQKLGLLYL